MQMFPASPGHSCGHVEPHFAVIDHFSTDEAARGSLGDFLPRTEPNRTEIDADAAKVASVPPESVRSAVCGVEK